MAARESQTEDQKQTGLSSNDFSGAERDISHRVRDGGAPLKAPDNEI